MRFQDSSFHREAAFHSDQADDDEDEYDSVESVVVTKEDDHQPAAEEPYSRTNQPETHIDIQHMINTTDDIPRYRILWYGSVGKIYNHLTSITVHSGQDSML